MATTSEFREYQRYPTGFFTLMTTFLMASNSLGTILRAFSSGDNWFLAFILFIYSSFFLLEWCYAAYHRLPRGQKSDRKNFLAIAIWCLFSGITFGFSYQFAIRFSFVPAVLTSAVALVASAIMFYVYIIQDGGEQCHGKCCGGYTYTTSDSQFKFTGASVEIIFEKV